MHLINLWLTIIDKSKDVVKALDEKFSDQFNVNVLRGDISQIPNADCLVVPGNSYGIMNYGVEKTVRLLVNDATPRIKNVIDNIYYGEQPIGTCILVEEHLNPKYKFIAHVPTMRFPGDVSNTKNAYVALRALLCTILNHNRISDNKIKTIVCTSFCTGEGMMSAEEAAKQMRLAWGFVDLGFPCSVENGKIINNLLCS